MTSSEEWDDAIAAEADAATSAAGKNGTTRKQLVPLLVEAMLHRIAAGTIQRPEIESDVARSLTRLDNARRATPEAFMHITDALNDNTILGRNDPALDMMIVIGTGDGIRKAWRYVTVVDMDAMVTYRRRKAKEVNDAFNLFADSVDSAKAAMREKGAEYIGDLFTGPPPDGGGEGAAEAPVSHE